MKLGAAWCLRGRGGLCLLRGGRRLPVHGELLPVDGGDLPLSLAQLDAVDGPAPLDEPADHDALVAQPLLACDQGGDARVGAVAVAAQGLVATAVQVAKRTTSARASA